MLVWLHMLQVHLPGHLQHRFRCLVVDTTRLLSNQEISPHNAFSQLTIQHLHPIGYYEPLTLPTHLAMLDIILVNIYKNYMLLTINKVFIIYFIEFHRPTRLQSSCTIFISMPDSSSHSSSLLCSLGPVEVFFLDLVMMGYILVQQGMAEVCDQLLEWSLVNQLESLK